MPPSVSFLYWVNCEWKYIRDFTAGRLCLWNFPFCDPSINEHRGYGITRESIGSNVVDMRLATSIQNVAPRLSE